MPNTPGAGAGLEYLEGVYSDAQHRLEVIIEGAALNHNGWTENRARLQLAEVDRIVAELHAEATGMAADSVLTGAQAAANAVDYHLAASATGVGAGTALGAGVNTQAVLVLAQALGATLEDAAAHVGRQARDAFQRIGVQHSAVGLATGETRRAISAGMQRDLLTQGISAFVDVTGRRWSLAAYTSMAARTSTREAVSAATRQRMEGLSLDLVTISDHGDTDELCDEYAGNTYSLSGDTPGYDVLPDEPPFHPNCIHVMTPAEANQEAFLSSLEEGVPEDALPVPTGEQPGSAHDVLRSGLPASEQRALLRGLRSGE